MDSQQIVLPPLLKLPREPSSPAGNEALGLANVSAVAASNAPAADAAVPPLAVPAPGAPGGVDLEDHVDLPVALALAPKAKAPLTFAQRSPAHLDHARKHRSLAVAKRKLEHTTVQLETSRRSLDTVVHSLPGAALLVGQSHGVKLGRRRTLRPQDFDIAARAVHIPLG